MVSVILNIEAFEEESGALNQLSICSAYLTLLLLVGIPLQLTFSLLEDYRMLPTDLIKKEYPILLEEVNASKLSGVLYYPFFFLR